MGYTMGITGNEIAESLDIICKEETSNPADNLEMLSDTSCRLQSAEVLHQQTQVSVLELVS